MSEQLRPVFTEGANTLEIHFNDDVVITDGSGLQVVQSINSQSTNNTLILGSDFTFDGFDPAMNIATWTFNTALVDGKYALHLSDSVADSAGNRLDADWDNATSGTPDIYGDDPTQSFAADLGDNTPGTKGGEFRFHFAILAGDYDGDGIIEGASELVGPFDGNGDGVVDAADESIGTAGEMLPLRAHGAADFDDDEWVSDMDFAIWSSNFGLRAATHADGDADGDTDVDGQDYLIWQTQNGSTVPANTGADFSGDGFVGNADYLIWEQGLGLRLPSPEDGDANNNSIVDGGDNLIWMSQFQQKSAWYIQPEAGFAALTVGVAPYITDVVIEGSSSQHDPFSFDTVDGSGDQLKTVPVGAADTISIVFSENVNISDDSLTVIGLTTAITPNLVEFIYDEITYTATWRFDGWALGDQYILSLEDYVSDIDGNLLDGEWTNPASITTTNSAVSEFPSGDGTPGGRFNFFMTLLPGDANLDGLVDGADYGILLTNWGVTTDALFSMADFNGDGMVDGIDFNLQGGNWGADFRDVWAVADLDGDYDIDGNDLDTITNNLGMTGATWADGDLNGDGEVTIEDLDLAFMQFGLGLDLVF